MIFKFINPLQNRIALVYTIGAKCFCHSFYFLDINSLLTFYICKKYFCHKSKQYDLYLYIKSVLSYNPGHNILELYNILLQIQFTTSITKLDVQYSKLGIRVAPRVAERLKILGN